MKRFMLKWCILREKAHQTKSSNEPTVNTAICTSAADTIRELGVNLDPTRILENFPK